MPFTAKKQVYSSRVGTVTLGTGANAIQLGGANVFPLYSFDAPIAIKPKIAVEISDAGLYPQPGLQNFYAGCTNAVDMARRAQEISGASFLCLHFESADPNGADTPAAQCARLAQEVAAATDMPLAVMGCHHLTKDAELFAEISAALPDRNMLFLSAREENYKEVAAAGQITGAESSIDINLAKQLNVLLTQRGVAPSSIVMHAGSAAAGYGLDYLISTLERIRIAALAQGDEQLQLPIITPVSTETWSVKESVLPEAESPAWGDAEERGIHMEIVTAAACITGGSDAVILRHPAAIEAVAALIDALVMEG